MASDNLKLNDFDAVSMAKDGGDDGGGDSETGSNLPTITPVKPPQDAKELEPINEIPVTLAAVLGEVVMPVGELLRLGIGSTIQLTRKVGEPIDVHLNNRLIARGEVVVNEERLGINMTEIIKKEA